MSTQAMPVDQASKDEQEPSKAGERVSERAAKAKPKKSAGAFRTISEVADALDVQQHVLRFWETKFSQVRPLKRGGGRRYYRPEDVGLLKRIHHLLYTEGYTIKGVQKLLREVGKNRIMQSVVPTQTEPSPAPEEIQAANVQPEKLSSNQRSVLQDMLKELKELRSYVSSEE